MIQPFQPKQQKFPGREYIDGDEESIISGMINELKEEVSRMYTSQKMLRQIHTKMHGCVKASFAIEPNLPDTLKVGVFGKPGSYPAWVRFSNANSTPQPDAKKDIRGIAIKLMNVKGDKILNDQAEEETQDFLLMSSETFFAKNLQHFRGLLKAATSKSKLKLAAFFVNPLHWPMLSRIVKSNIECKHPFEIPYFSTQPFQFGDQSRAVKYYLQPSLKNKLLYNNLTDPDYLRLNMVKTLEQDEISFDFFIQLQGDPDKMPIEDPTVPWSSPFIKLAELRIPAQVFDTAEQREFGENLSFNAWHSLPEHRPLGSFNRARRRVYEELSRFRHEKNGVDMLEPKSAESLFVRVKKSEAN